MSVAHEQDPAINERRLRPIYDHLDYGNNKKALQEADKVLKKYPSIQCARALKALVLLRLGREDEATGIVEKLAAEKPTDISTLQAMTYCYKDQDELDKICNLYDNAARAQPGDEELLTHLFMAHVRVQNYQAQQTVALQLYKHHSKNPYYFWAVTSIVLKALHGPDARDATKSRVLLALAQRMIDKHIADGRLEDKQEVQLYLNVLTLQGKHAEVLHCMDSELGKRLYPGAPCAIRIEALKTLERWPELEQLSRELLKDNRERWDYYQVFVQCAVELNRTSNDDSTALASVPVAQLRAYHDYIVELIDADSGRTRGPHLGRLLLYKTLQSSGVTALDELFASGLQPLLLDYFRQFGHKPCCTNDIQMFLGCLDDESRGGLAEQLLGACAVSATALPQTRDQMQQHICTLQVARICGAHELNVEHLTALYTAFSLHYEHGMTSFGMDLLSTDMGPSDAYALLAAHVMYDVGRQLRSSAPLIEALCLLSYLLSNSPSNFHAKLLCLQIYHRLGCGWGAHKTYETLDVKHVQLDSMGYLHCAQLPIAGIPAVAKPLYEQTLKFFTASYKESLEYMSICYRYGSFSKLQEFMEFRDRLSNSLHYGLCSAEALLAEMVGMSAASAEQIRASVAAFNLEPARDRIAFAEMTDNRDLSVVVRWSAAGEADRERADGAAAFAQDVQLLRLRSFMLRMVGACVDVYNAPGGGEPHTKATGVLSELRDRWIQLVAEVRDLQLEPVSSARLADLLPSRLHGILQRPYAAFFDALLALVLALEAGGGAAVTLKELNGAEDALHAVLTDVEQGVRNAIAEHGRAADALWQRRDVQECIVNGLEIVALASLVLSVACDKYKGLCSTRAGRKTKQKQQQQQQQQDQQQPNSQHLEQNGSSNNAVTDRDRLGVCQSLVGILQVILGGMDEWIRDWSAPLCPDNLVERIAAMSLNPNVEPLVQTTLRDSHAIAVQELRAIIKEKLRMLRGRD